jgi:hypothetical protein
MHATHLLDIPVSCETAAIEIYLGEISRVSDHFSVACSLIAANYNRPQRAAIKDQAKF